MDALDVLELTKVYGDVKVLNSVSLSVDDNEIFGLLGPNGAGKTTLMEIVAGIRAPTSGSIRIFGVDALKGRRKANELLGFIPQETMLYEDLTGLENLRFFASLYGMDRSRFEERVKELAEKLEVTDLLKKRIDKLSGGQKRRLSLLASLLHHPRLLLMDEPTVGLDPDARREFWALIWGLRDEGSTILLSTHYMEEADELCDRVAVIDEGKIVAQGKPEDLKMAYGGMSKVMIYPRLRLIEAVEKTLRSMGLKVDRSGDALAVLTRNPEGFAPKVITFLSERGMRPERVEIRGPSLEDVFLNLTGRPLEVVR